ncbi:MAG: hypothetical protein ACRDGA_09845, partial [Bacteroidota bacterium]
MMKNKLLSFATLSSLLVALVAWVAPVSADVNQRINALEEELAQLKAEQQQVKTEQMELRKEALAAEEKLPEFRYRPGRGLRIRAADRSWSWTFGLRTEVFMYNHPGGNPIITDGSIINGTTTQPRRRTTGMHNGQFFLRRNRPSVTMCWDDCFYEMEWVLTAEDDPVTPRDVELMF